METIDSSVMLDPLDMLLVKYRDRNKKLYQVAAFSVAYIVAVTKANRAGIAVEILYDPYDQSPDISYVCHQYKQLLVSPKTVVSIEPYWK